MVSEPWAPGLCVLVFWCRQSINKNTLFSIEPAFRATFPQALVVLVGRSMDTLQQYSLRLYTVLRVPCSYLYVGASLGSGSVVFSVCAVLGIGVLWAPGAGRGARLVVHRARSGLLGSCCLLGSGRLPAGVQLNQKPFISIEPAFWATFSPPCLWG